MARSGSRSEAETPRSCAANRPQPRRAGFTLIELLVVMLVIVILAGIVFKAGRVLQERGKIQQAKADVARLAMALERYYTDHGCYPPGGDPAAVNTGVNTRDFDFMLGWAQISGGFGGCHLWLYLDEDCGYRRDRRSYISGWPKDRLGTMPLTFDGRGGTVLRYYKDPWGNPYRYIMDASSVEKRGGYFVASAGPNGLHGQGANVSVDNLEGRDDIWAGSAGAGGEQMGR